MQEADTITAAPQLVVRARCNYVSAYETLRDGGVFRERTAHFEPINDDGSEVGGPIGRSWTSFVDNEGAYQVGDILIFKSELISRIQ